MITLIKNTESRYNSCVAQLFFFYVYTCDGIIKSHVEEAINHTKLNM